MVIDGKKEKYDNTKPTPRIRKSKDRQYQGQMKTDKGANNDPQNTTQITEG